MITTVNKNDLIALGFSEGTSRNIIRKGKLLLVKRGFEVYKNKKNWHHSLYNSFRNVRDRFTIQFRKRG